MTVDTLPPINAALNATSAVLLVTGYLLVRRGSYRAHAGMMISALGVSSVFLVFYLWHKQLLHAATGSYNTSTADVSPAIWRHLYLWVLLLPHLVLAMAMVPMILTTVFFAATRRWAQHRRIARPTFWVWLYVSVSGVGVYFVLYHLFPHLRGGG